MSIAVPRRARKALLAAALPAALAATALPASADAATARLNSSGALEYIAASGEANDVRVVFTGLHLLIDDTAPITAGTGCVLDDDRRAVCVPGTGQARYSLGNGRDVMRYDTPHAAKFEMGTEDDTYFGGLREDSIGTNGLVVQPVDVIGGTGSDLITYRNAPRAVTVTLDGQLNDGDRGKENVRPDWEHIEGSSGRDRLTGSNDANKVEQYTGGPGNDILVGLDGTDIFNEGSAPNGADFFNGSGGQDRVNYGARTNPVRVTMSDLAPNDGEAGEGDNVDPNVNDITGGSGSDVLAGASGPNVIDGRAGNDSISGLGGIDRLIGGSNPDRLFGGTGNDTLETADNVADEAMACEAGDADVLNRDLKDVEASGCEIVNSVGILKLAPTEIVTEAGKPAKLRMSWSHPKSWKQLRKVVLRVEDAGKVVVRPRAERIQDTGAVKVLRSSRITTKGKKVTAHLALKLDRGLAGETLSLDVQATDTKGRRQLQRDAGTLRIG